MSDRSYFLYRAGGWGIFRENGAGKPARRLFGKPYGGLEHPDPVKKADMPSLESQLRQWPVQIQLVPAQAPYFENAKLLIAADCAAYAYGNFHAGFIRDRITLIGCPKLDSVNYGQKFSAILSAHDILEILVARMEVPCCGGLEFAVKKAMEISGKRVPCEVVTISAGGNVVSQKKLENEIVSIL